MQHFHRDGQDYWGGLHRELGLLIYDPRDQQRLAGDKVRLYVVVERRLATFVKAHVRAGLVSSRLETWWCPQHAVVMQAQRPGDLVQPPSRRRHLVHRPASHHPQRRSAA